MVNQAHWNLISAGLLRWAVILDNAETGSNNGSDFALAAFNDAGTFLANGFLINRKTGLMTVPGPLTSQGTVTGQNFTAGTSAGASASITVSGCTMVFTGGILVSHSGC